jgi:small subunit ribosomal protein S3
MGNKVHPRILRTGIIYGWESKWFANKRDFAKLLEEDIAIKEFLRKKLKESSVDRIEVERTPRALTVTIHSAKPGFIIGRGGTGVEDLKKQLRTLISKGKEKLAMNLNIIEVTNPSLSAEIIAQSMAADTEKRMPFRRVIKTHMERVQKAGAKGVKVLMKGRLNGAEIARDEKLSWGSVPLHNLRADINYATATARTMMGAIGIKVWIYRGEVFDGEKAPTQTAAPAAAPARRPLPSRAAARPASRPSAPRPSTPRAAAAK